MEVWETTAKFSTELGSVVPADPDVFIGRAHCAARTNFTGWDETRNLRDRLSGPFGKRLSVRPALAIGSDEESPVGITQSH
jgi:hypothetical protein